MKFLSVQLHKYKDGSNCYAFYLIAYVQKKREWLGRYMYLCKRLKYSCQVIWSALYNAFESILIYSVKYFQ